MLSKHERRLIALAAFMLIIRDITELMWAHAGWRLTVDVGMAFGVLIMVMAAMHRIDKDDEATNG